MNVIIFEFEKILEGKIIKKFEKNFDNFEFVFNLFENFVNWMREFVFEFLKKNIEKFWGKSTWKDLEKSDFWIWVLRFFLIYEKL